MLMLIMISDATELRELTNMLDKMIQIQNIPRGEEGETNKRKTNCNNYKSVQETGCCSLQHFSQFVITHLAVLIWLMSDSLQRLQGRHDQCLCSAIHLQHGGSAGHE